MTNGTGSVPTSLQFTSDSGTGPEEARPVERRESSLDKVMRDSPVVRFLSRGERERDEQELQQVEEERAQREQDIGDVTDLEPLPSQNGDGGGKGTGRGSGDVARTTSGEPLLS
jgi:hypothetical protein